jgi:hypothetical protein
MRVLISSAMIIAFLFPAVYAPAIHAEDARPEGSRTPVSSQRDEPGRSPLTGKERLSKKWTDEQRTDDCKVPPEKRGAKPRPDCPPVEGR